MAELRAALSAGDDEIARLARSIAEDRGSPAPQASESLAALKERVEALGREGKDWQREASELRAAQEQIRAQLEAQAAQLEALAERPADQMVEPAPAPDEPGSRWSEARRSGLYTLQLGGFQRQESLDWFLKRHKITGETAVHETQRRGRPWWAVLRGIYGSFGEAAAAIGELPADLVAHGPWVRKIPDTGDLSPLPR
jgi:septal ring-binding cell division protein DamX